MTFRALGVAGLMRPGVGGIGCRVAVQIKDLDYPFPYRFAVENLFYRDTLPVRGLHAMQFLDYLAQFLDIGHVTASTKFPTLQNPDVTPAAIAGVQRSVP